MNGKKAKRFRVAARSQTQGKSAKAYIAKKFNKTVMTEKGPVSVTTVQIMLHPECTRRVYKDYKIGKRIMKFYSDAQVAKMMAAMQGATA